jgi:lysophospholipase L1-like esterase
MMKVYLLLFSFNLLAANTSSFVMGALGDSISTGFNSYHWLSDRGRSWSTGKKEHSDFESHKMKIEKLIERPVKAYNEAIPGSKSKSLIKQVKRLLRKAPHPDYVTILMGANDICSWKNNYQEPLENYKKNVLFAVDRITKANPKVKIILVPIPNMFRLYELFKDKKKCQRVWNFFPLCDSLFSQKVSESDRELIKDKVKDTNQKLKEISELFPINAFYYDFLADLDFDEEHISTLDCFHPSAFGQKMISEYTFNRDLFQEWIPTKNSI